MRHKVCAADDCENRFEPVIEGQEYCNPRCAVRMRVKRYRERQRMLPGGPNPPRPRRLPSRNQLTLFSSSGAKPPKSVKQKPLFQMEEGKTELVSA